MYKRELQIAIQAVKKAEPMFRKYFGTWKKVQKKNGNYRDLVSYADKKIEKTIQKFLKEKFPKYGFVGEEGGNDHAQSEFTWTLDPVDGTTNYLQGLPECGIGLALLKKDRPVAGVISLPILKQLYTARLNSGAHWNGKKINVSRTRDPKNGFGSFAWGRDIGFAKKRLPKTLETVRKLRVLGSSAVSLGLVARGLYDFYIAGHMKIWDYALGQIIVEEAGGSYQISKKPPLQIAANKILAKKLLTLLSSWKERRD